MQRSTKCCAAEPGSTTDNARSVGPGSAEQREEALHRVRDTAANAWGRPLAPGAFSSPCHIRQAKSSTSVMGRISMSDFALPGSIEPARRNGPNLDGGFHPLTGI